MKENGIVKADKLLRQQVLVGAAIFCMAGALFIVGLSKYMEEIVQVSRSDHMQALNMFDSLLTTVRVVNSVLSLVFALYFADLGLRILGAGRYPPEGMRVIKDTKIQFGGSARMMAIASFALAVTILSTNLVLFYMRTIFEELLQK